MSTSEQSSAPTASPELIQTKFELGIWYTLFNWSVLTAAIQNQWGGPDSADKRDWLAGAISEIFTSAPETDSEDLEVVLLQAMEDEFGVRLEDETEVAVARSIMKIRGECMKGDFGTVDELQRKWEARKGKEVATGDVRVEERVVEDDGDSVDEESGSDSDVEMGDAPAPKPKEKREPEIDEDGFEKVVRRK